MNVFDVMHQEIKVETDRLLLECANAQLEASMSGSYGIFEESGEKGIIATFIESFSNIITAIVNKIRKLFGVGSKGDKALAAAESDPEAKKKKFTMKNYKKLKQVNDDTVKKLGKAKSDKEVDAIMKSHRKKRNAIIAGAAAVTVTIASIALYARRRSKDTEGNLKKAKNTVIAEMEKKQKAAEKQGDAMEAFIKKQSTSKQSNIKATADTSKSYAEIFKDYADDEVNCLQDSVKACQTIVRNRNYDAWAEEQRKARVGKSNTPINPNPGPPNSLKPKPWSPRKLR